MGKLVKAQKTTAQKAEKKKTIGRKFLRRLPLTGYELKLFRKSRGLTQHELAKELETTQVRISNWEAGASKTLPSNALKKLLEMQPRRGPKKEPIVKTPKTGKELRKFRIESGLTQAQVAEVLGTHQPIVSVLEKSSERLPTRIRKKIKNIKKLKSNHREYSRQGREGSSLVKRVRLKLSLTQTELAKKIGTSQGQISLWEGGVNLPDHIRVKLRKMKDKKI